MDGAASVVDKHFMSGLLEVDVTILRRRVRSLNREGESVSFTSWIIKAVGESVASNPQVQAIQRRQSEVVVFDDVDVVFPVEKEVNGVFSPMPVIIRGANKKSVSEINAEILSTRDQRVTDEADYVHERHDLPVIFLWLYTHLPRSIRVGIMRRMIASPFRAKKYTGTVYVTTVNAVGRGSGWALPTRSACNLAVALGSITRKPWGVEGRIELREILHLTVSFNHDVIDGVPARRFIDDLVRRIETASDD